MKQTNNQQYQGYMQRPQYSSQEHGGYSSQPSQQSPGRQYNTFSANQNLAQLKQMAQNGNYRQQQQGVNPQTQAINQIARQIESRKMVGPEFSAKYNEVHVGYIEDTRELVCNSEIFNKKLAGVRFTALVCKELRAEFNKVFNQYNAQVNNVKGVDPELVKQRATILVQKFFAQIREKVKNLQRESMTKIQHSESLKELEKIIETSKEFLPDPAKQGGSDHFEREKKMFDEKIGKGRFAYLVKRQDFYQDLISSLDKSSDKMKQTLDKSTEQMKKVLKMRQDPVEIRSKLDQIVSECIDVDMQSVQTSHLSPEKQGLYRHQNSTTQAKSQSLFESPRQSNDISMTAQVNSNINSSMVRNVPQLNSSIQNTHISPVRQQTQQQRYSEQVNSNNTQTNYTFGKQNQMVNSSGSQERLSSSPQNTQARFSPINKQPVQQVSATPPQMASPQRPQQQQVINSPSQKSAASLQDQQSDDCVIVTNVVKGNGIQENQSQVRLEHQFKSTYKHKGQFLLKLIPNRGWVKIRETKDLFLSKVVQTPDETALLIGGSKDRNSGTTLSDVTSFCIQNGKVVSEDKKPMLTSRSSHGATINVYKNEIYVAGGYHEGQLTKTCEVYNIKNNEWKQLPPLNEEKCSPTLSVLNGRYLYCFGGLSKHESSVFLLSSIEMLDLDSPNPRWVMLSIKMPHQVCDLGALPLNSTDILLFGGWNKQAIPNAFILKQQIQRGQSIHTFVQVGTPMEKPDFFMISGVAMKTMNPDEVKVAGHTSLYSYNLKTNCFTGTSAM